MLKRIVGIVLMFGVGVLLGAMLSTLLASCALEVSDDPDSARVEVEGHAEALTLMARWTAINSSSGKPFAQESNMQLGVLRNYIQRYNPKTFTCRVANAGPECFNSTAYLTIRNCAANPPGTSRTTCYIYQSRIDGLHEDAAAQFQTGGLATLYFPYDVNAPIGTFKAVPGQYKGWWGDNSLEFWR